MDVTSLPHYGKDILTIGKASQMRFGDKLVVAGAAQRYLGGVIGALGLGGTRRLIREFKAELTCAQAMDWSDLMTRGMSQEDLDGILKKLVLAKVQADLMGMEQAAALRRRLSGAISVRVFTEMFAPAATFMACGGCDFLPPFKRYYTAMMDAMAERGLEQAVVVEDTADTFQLNVTYCAWAEVAKRLGNGEWCYFSTCYGDEVWFPHLAGEAGFTFRRTGTLAQGCEACDFRFERKAYTCAN